jgi:Bardet-Biedl syndrome 2 protein
MADDSQRVKALIVRAEDSRLMVDMESMRRAYTQLYGLNNQLVGAYNTRASNHEALIAALKEVNLAIQRASNLRLGVAKTKLVTAARAAVKANNMEALLKAIGGR